MKHLSFDFSNELDKFVREEEFENINKNGKKLCNCSIIKIFIEGNFILW